MRQVGIRLWSDGQKCGCVLLYALFMNCLRHLFPLLALWLILASEATLRGQEITHIKDVTSLNALEAGQNPRAVKLRGVVTEVGVAKASFTINDGTNGIGVVLAAGMTCPALGDDVEVEGKTMTFTVAGFVHPRVQAAAVRVVGTRKLPEPVKLSLTELNSFKHFERWVSVEGFVLRWKFRPTTQELIVCIAGVGTWTTFTLRTDGRPEWLPNLMRAKVRVTGINAGVNTHSALGALIAPSLAQFEILTPGSGSAFDAPLVSIKEVNARTLEPGIRVKVRGVVAAQNGFQVNLRGEGGAQLNALQSPWEREPGSTDELVDSGPWPVLSPGDEVEFVGSASVAPNYALNFGDVRVIGKGSIAPPEKVDLEAMKAGNYTDNWITLEARVYAWASKGDVIMYSVWGDHDNVTIHVPTPPSLAFPNNLYGAKVRFTGTAHRFAPGTSYYIPGPSYFEVLEPGTADPFAVPETNPADIAADRVPLGAPVKFKGTVVGLVQNTVAYVRTPNAALCVTLMPPLPRASGSLNGYADYGPLPVLKTGDEVEVMGWAIRSESDSRIAPFDLVSGSVRVLNHSESPPPVTTTFTRIANGEHTSDLVQVRGRLLTIEVQPVSRDQWRTTMLLKADGKRMTAVYQSAVLHPFDSLKADDDVLIQAVVDRASASSPRQLWLLSPNDARSLGLSPDVVIRRLWMWGGGFFALLALFSGWVVALRKSVRVKAEMNSTLEKRVEERTTELKKTQDELERALSQERELGELKSRFVTTVSHEFRTPLGIIMSAVELLQHYSERLPEEEKQRQLHEIQSSTKHMGGLMEQVLLLGRAEAGKLTCNPQPIDLAAFAERIIDETQSISNRKCPIHMDVEGDISAARADEALLRHILSNLVSNAVKYSPEAAPVTLRLRREGLNISIKVIDHGIGIPEKDRARLFEAFHRCSNVGETPGTGLGLVIVKRCVDLHSGSLQIDSEIGIGSTFSVKLPVYL